MGCVNENGSTMVRMVKQRNRNFNNNLYNLSKLFLFLLQPLYKTEEKVQFANENELAFVEDSSNSSSKYTRNFFRNELIPAISSVYPQVKENLKT